MPEISNIVRVSAILAPQGVLRREFGRTLFLYPAADSPDLDRRARDLRVNEYASQATVANDYGTTEEAYRAGNIYFQQVPYPRDFLTAAWFEGGAVSQLVGTVPDGPLTAIKALSNTTITVAGQSLSIDLDVTGTGNTGFGNIAAALQTAIRTIADPDLSGATVTYDTDHFVVSVPSGADLGGVFAGAAAGTLGLGETAVYQRGTPPETVTEALDRIEAINNSWYWLTLAPAIYTVEASALAVAAWAAPKTVQLVIDNTNMGVLLQNEAASIPAKLSALEYDRTSVVWSRTPDYKAVSLAGRFSSVNFAAPNALITAKFKDLPGTLPDDITSTQKAELDRKRLNHYSPFGGDSIFVEGWTLRPGTWIDVRYWLDWLVNATQIAVYNRLRQSPARIPQTDDGIKAIQNVVENVMEQGVRNGGAAPGQLSEALANDVRLATGNREFNGFLSTGYLVYIEPVALQPQSDRTQRKAPPVRVWAKGSGAVHFVEVSIVFEN